MLGDAEAGKTALLAAFEQKNYFQRDYRITQSAQVFVQGVDVLSKGGQPQHVELLLLEVGGHELFRQSRNKLVRETAAEQQGSAEPPLAVLSRPALVLLCPTVSCATSRTCWPAST